MLRSTLLVLAALLLAPAASATPDPLVALTERFADYDHDRDGAVEIVSLTPLPGPRGPASGPGVLVLVEDRLLEPLAGAVDLTDALRIHADDLIAEGYRPRYLAATLPRTPRHQDGRTLLALRAFLQAARRLDPALAGVLLVGRFPDAYLVRSCNWIKRTPLVLRRKTPTEKRFQQRVPYLRSRAGPVARRADIVLADLDGAWDAAYVEPTTRIPWSLGVFPQGVPPAGGVANDHDQGVTTFRDFFFVDDAKRTVAPVGSRLRIVPHWDQTDAECAASDKTRKNPIAQPELAVSRIDAHGVAYSPRPEMLDAAGRPRAVSYKGRVPDWRSVWIPDPRLERRLLVEYFARNHRFRRGYLAPGSFRPAAIAHGLRSGFRAVRRGHPSWKRFKLPGYDVQNASLPALIAWWKRPAALRTLRAHSDRWGSVFARAPVSQVASAAGPAWSWSRRGKALVPSLASAVGRGKADFWLYRTLYENGLRPDPSIVIHTGCDAISPPGAERLPWSHPAYGRFANGEGLLFYAGVVALVGRAKVFYDEPRDFSGVLRRGGTVGDAWRRYFELESRGPTVRHVGGRIGRKRAYFWSLIGDWTLKLRPPPRWR